MGLPVPKHIVFTFASFSILRLHLPSKMLQLDMEHLNFAQHPFVFVLQHFVAFLQQLVLMFEDR